MTFYNLPDTDVKIEYDKDKKLLQIFNLPEDHETVEGHGPDHGSYSVYVGW